MAEVIDAFSHVLPQGFAEAMDEIHPTDQLGNLENAPHLWDVDKRLTDMDEFGVDRQVLTLARPPIWRGLDPETARPAVETANDEVRRIADEHPDRFIPVATLPYPTADYVDEFDRCVEDLGMAGIQIFSNVGGRPLDDEAFHPIYERAAETGTPIWIHPQLHEWYDWIDEYMDDKMLGWPFDTSLALSRLVFAGVLEKYPDLKIVPHHMGGMLPFYGERIRSYYRTRIEYPEVYPIDFPEFSRSLDDYFGQFYADTAVNTSRAALRCGHEFYGADNVVFGVDYPLGPEEGRAWLRETIEAIEEMDLSSADRQKIMGENVKELVGE